MLNDRVFIANHDKDSGDWTARISLLGLKGGLVFWSVIC